MILLKKRNVQNLNKIMRLNYNQIDSFILLWTFYGKVLRLFFRLFRFNSMNFCKHTTKMLAVSITNEI